MVAQQTWIYSRPILATVVGAGIYISYYIMLVIFIYKMIVRSDAVIYYSSALQSDVKLSP